MAEIPFGRQMRERRRALDLTQEELARRVGCAAITIRKLEAGTLRASQQVAERLAVALAVATDERTAFVRAARSVIPDAKEPGSSPRPGLPAPEEIGGADLSGRAVRGYQLGERLGAGGFGAVYRALQPLVEREVAVKIILPQYADQPEFIRRFEAEAQLVARLEHPHIVPLYDYWREPGVAYLVMRLLRGGSLHALLQQGPPALERTRSIVEQLGAALHVAHRAGVVHRDLKPANVLLDEDGNAYLADFGIAKDLQQPADLSFGPVFVGSPAYSSPEQIRAEPVTPQTDVYALGILVYELLTGQKPFEGPTPASYIQQHLSAAMPPLAARRAGLPGALDRAIQRATAKVPSARFNDIADFVAELQAALDRNGAPTHALAAAPAQAAPPTLLLDLSDADNPYRGLRPFGEADAAAFFGREALVQQLLARLSEGGELARFFAVVGPSGSGKSSVVRAGLIPALRSGGLPGSEQWYVVDLLPGARPMAELAAALCRLAPAGVDSEDLTALLWADHRGLLRAARMLLPADPATELLLVIDQFEELFTLTTDEATRAHLLDSIVTAVLDERSRLRIVVTLRADFVDRPLQYVDFGELIRQRNELVLPLTPDELEHAIVGPARRAGLALEDGLVAALVADVRNQPGGLPLLQHALSELFAQRRGRMLTRAAYAAIGGVAGALARSAEQIYGGLGPGGRDLTRQLFLRLVTPGEAGDDTRRRVRLSELPTQDEEPLTANEGWIAGDFGRLAFVGRPELATDLGQTKPARPPLSERRSAVLDAFGAARLLSLDRDPTTREPTVEVAHEALLREWPRLRGWLDATRADLRVQQRLAQDAAEWEQAGHKPGYLAAGARLAQYEMLGESGSLALSAKEAAFLTASLTERAQQAAAERERQARELAQAQTTATALRSAAQRLGLLVGALTLFLLAATGLATFAFTQQRAADQQARLANVRAWSAAALNSLEVDPERSLLLSLHAVDTTYGLDGSALPEAEDALRRSLHAAKIKRRLEQAGFAFWMDWSDDGQRIAIQSHAPEGQKLLSIWDRSLSTRVFTATADSLGVWVNLSPDNRLVAFHSDLFERAGGAEQPAPRSLTTRVYDLSTGQLRYELPILLPTFSPDGTQLLGLSSAVLAGTNYELMTYATATGQLLHAATLGVPLADVHREWFSPDLKRCVLVLYTSDLSICDTATGAELYRLPSQNDNSHVLSIAFSPDRRRLAVGWLDGSIQLYATEREDAVRLERTLQGGELDILALAFSPDGTRLAVGGRDRAIGIWDIATGRKQLVLAGHSASVDFLVFSPDGSELLSSDQAGGVRIWDVLPSREQDHYFLATYTFSMSPQRTHIIATDVDQNARVWDLSGQSAMLELVGHTELVETATWSDDQRLVATAASDQTARLWDVATGRQLVTMAGHTGWVFSVDLSPDASRLASGGADMTARIWDAQTGQELLRLDHPQEVNAVLFSPDGTRLYSGLSQLGDVLVWDTASGKLLATWSGHNSSIFGMILSPDGARLATISRDGEARIWDAASGAELLVLRGHTGDVFGVDFSPDGTLLATASYDATVRVWNAETGQVVKLIPTGESAVNVAFTADAAHLVVSTVTNSATIYTLALDELLMLGRERLTRSWTPAECRQFLQLESCPATPAGP